MVQSDKLVRDFVLIEFKSNLRPTKLSNEALLMFRSAETHKLHQILSLCFLLFNYRSLDTLLPFTDMIYIYNGGVS